MDDQRVRPGHLLAVAGALAAIGSLWAPWFQLSVTDGVRQLINGEANSILQPQAANIVHAATSSLPDTVQIDAWQIFHWTDLLIAGLGGLVLLFVLAAGGAFGSGLLSAKRAGSYCMRAGALVGIQTGYQIVTSHGPSGLVKPAWGAYLCLAGAAAIIGGGLWASMGPSLTTEAWVSPEAPATPALVHGGLADPGASVAPPGI